VTEHNSRADDAFVAVRPWGQFQQFVQNERVTVKIITVQPGHRLSLQKHGNRDEMWQVLDTPIYVEVDGRAWDAQVGEIVWVTAGAEHRMTNRSTQSGRLLEIAFGDFDESDIVRIEDDYARLPRLDGSDPA
jgi:mannose-6-phosphate isomerase-like protein (cupin superfamily)